jgi:hypothetical protein
MMKSKLSAVLVVAGCVLAVSPANAISVTLNLGATTSSVPGAVLFDDFDSVVDTTIGTITGGRPQDPSHGTPPATGNFIIADGLLGSPFNLTVTFTNPVAYVGFAWGTRTFSTNSMYMMVLLFSVHSLASLAQTRACLEQHS